MIKYRFARSLSGILADINTIDGSSRIVANKYHCIGCDQEMVARIGERNAKHFAHRSVENCSPITYLHKLAQQTFMLTYERCLAEKTPFMFTITRPWSCTRHEALTGEPCVGEETVDVDLTQYFKKIEVEKGYKGFVPDILLTSNSGRVLFVEIAVTHTCEPNKIALGEKIIELTIKHEDHIEPIAAAHLRENRVRCHNFEKATRHGDICQAPCDRRLNVFVVYRSGKSILLEASIQEYQRIIARESVLHQEVTGWVRSQSSQISTYKEKVHDAYFKGIRLKNCYLCRYHGAGGIDSAVFCKLKKQDVASNDATTCSSYRPVSNKAEWDRIDTTNQAFAERKYDRALVNRFLPSLGRN
ncbi:competence protein CoiA family protein [Allohahella marinimesophila]|uniref:Competence protein CoiA family protein n=1 Tax=Allohahella marinimesophila TaxID=1054972 RepID=A0ABP7PVX4_9GAMM